MNDGRKTKEQLIGELAHLRHRVSELELTQAVGTDAEEALREIKVRYDLATKASQTGVWDWDLQTAAIFVDPNLKSILGYEDYEIRNQLDDWSRLVHPDDADAVMTAATAHIEDHTPAYEIVHRMVHRDGSIRWFLARGTALRDENGVAYRMIGTDTDITELKKTEIELWEAKDAMRQSKAELNEAQEVAHVGSWRFDLSDNSLLWADETYRIIGIPIDTPLRWDGFLKCVHPGDRDYVNERWTAALHGDPYDFVHRILVADETRWVHEKVRITFDDGGKVKAMMGTIQDITEHKRAQEALRLSEQIYRTLFTQIADPIFIFDKETLHFLDCNQSALDHYGYTLAELRKMTPHQLHPSKDHAVIEEKLRDEEDTSPHSYTHVTKRGEIIQVEIHTASIEYGGKDVWISIVRDITMRVQVEKDLIESEEKLRNIFENSTNLFYSLTPDHLITYLSPQVKDILGYTPEEALIKWAELVSDNPINMIGLKLSAKAIETGKPQTPYELEMVHKNGEKVWVEVREAPVVKDGNTVSIVGAINDITERKLAMMMLMESEERLKILFESAPDGYYLNDLKGNFIDGNKAAEKLLDYKREELIGKNFTKLNLLSLGELPRAAISLAKNALGQSTGPEEFNLTRKDGSVVPVEIRTHPVKIKGKTVVLGIARDISDRKLAMESLRQERNIAQQYLDIAGAIFVVINDKGDVTLINQKGCDILGYSEEEIIGKNWFENFIPERLREDIIPVSKQLLAGENETAEYNENPIRTKSGDERLIAWHNTIIKDNEGNITSHLSSGEDITSRVQAEKAIRERTEDLTLVNALNHAANRGDNIRQLCQLLCQETGRIFSCTGMTVYMLSEDGQHLVSQNQVLPPALVKSIKKLTGSEVMELRIPLKPGSWYFKVLQDGKPRITHDPSVIQKMMADCTTSKVLQKFVPQIYKMLNINSVLTIPLVVQGISIGMIDMSRSESFKESDLPRLKVISEQVTAVIRNLQATETLSLVSRQNELILTSAGEGIFGLDVLGNVTFVNPAAANILGWEHDEMSDRLQHEIIHHSRPDGSHYPQEECPICATLKDGKPHRVSDEVFWGKNGTSIPVEYVCTPIRERGELVGAVIAFKDISERIRVETALEVERNLLRTVIDNLPDFVYAKDTKSQFVLGNLAIAFSMGVATPEELLGKTDFDFYPQELAERFYTEEQEIISSGKLLINKEEPYIVLMASRPGWLSTTRVPLRDSRGETVGIVGIGRDITERKKAEEERELLLTQIHEQAKQMQQTIDTVPEGVLLLDTNGQVLLANPVAVRDLAVLADARVGDIISHLGGRPLVELLNTPPTKGIWHEVMADNQTFEIISQPMGSFSEPEEWVLVINDVTQEREIQQRIQHQDRLAVVGQMAAGIAHDFNNILAVITLYTEMELKNLMPSSQLHGHLQTILQQTYRASDLIQQILDFSRRAVLERKSMDLGIFLKEVVKLLERTMPESITIIHNFGTEKYTVNADPTRIQQSVMNLFVNARDAMPEGGEVHIVLSRVPMMDAIRCVTCGPVVEGQWISITVKDTGSGIPPDVLPRIFEPFFTTKIPGQGTGLGLPQVYGIVKQHAGHIDVTSTMGKGTTFTIYLPALMVQEVEESWVFTDTPRGQGETVLVVEDNAIMREAFSDILEMLNYQVMIAPNGRDALDILEKYGHRVALVLSDMVMPVMSGKSLFYALKEQYPEIRMIILTGHPMEKELSDMLAEGLSGYLLKPPNIERLAQEVSLVMKGESE